MEKKRKFLFLKVTLVLLVFLLFNLFFYAYESKSKPGFTGFSIKSDVAEIYSSMSHFSRIFFVGQWVILIFILFFIFIKERKTKKYNDESINLNIKKFFNKTKTDLDILYDILKKQKELKISTISKSFNVGKEVSKEWCEILESANLATIEYPGFGEPVVRIVNKNIDNSIKAELKLNEKKGEISEKIQKKLNKKKITDELCKKRNQKRLIKRKK